jgi:signal transduction histidine kinase
MTPRTQRRPASASAGTQTERVLIRDGPLVHRLVFRMLLEAVRRIIVAGKAATRAEAVALARRARAGQLRLDGPHASRARIVAKADEALRRIERDLHDGSQQRLVTLVLEVQAIKNAVRSDRPELLAQLSHLEDGLRGALEELREIARGAHPSILSHGGLRPALKSLARRSPLLMEIELGQVHRLPEPVEVAVYYIVSEALANTVKHAHASILNVALTVVDHTLHVCIRDDGVGGADPARGSGLFGLKDRVEALGGTMTMQSPLGAGTSLRLEIPVERRPSRFRMSYALAPAGAPVCHQKVARRS